VMCLLQSNPGGRAGIIATPFNRCLISKLNIRWPGADKCLRHRSSSVWSSCCCCCRPCCRPAHRTTAVPVLHRGGVATALRRNAITPGRQAPPARSTRTIHPLSVADLQRRQNGVVTADRVVDDVSPAAESVPSSRRSSNEVSIRDFLKVSKISMAMMQKQLYETAHRGSVNAGAMAVISGGRSQAHSTASNWTQKKLGQDTHEEADHPG